MKIPKILTTFNPVSVLLLALVAMFVIRGLSVAAGETVADVGHAIDPFNNNNIFNRFFEYGYQSVTGSKGTPGGDLAGWVHDDVRWWN